MEPTLTTVPRLLGTLEELRRREPIFHRPEFGTTRADFDRMMDANFREIGASGLCYSRDYVLDVLEERHRGEVVEHFDARDFHCLEIAPDHYLLTYTLQQEARLTRRATLWRRSADGWKILYHQGTVVADAST